MSNPKQSAFETGGLTELACETSHAAPHDLSRHLPIAFVVLGTAIGLIYAFVMPPLQVADEGSHFARLYSVSRGTCVASPDIDIPQSFAQLNALFPPWLERSRRMPLTDLHAALKIPLNHSVMAGNARQRSLEGFINQNLYCCLPYVPAAMVLNAARHLRLPPLALMYLSRITNLAAYIALTFFALRLLPDFRWVLFCVALMPMTMHQAASISADSMGFALSFLLCAYVLRLAFAKPPIAMGLRQLLVLGLLVLLAALSRSMVAFVVLPLLIPAANFKSSLRRWSATAAYALLALLCLGLWQHVNRSNFERMAEERMGRPALVDVASNTRFLYQHPLATASMFARTAADFDYVRAKLTELVGRFGWLSVSLPGWLVCLYLGLLIAAALTQTRHTRLAWGARAILLLFVWAGAINILTAGWVLETPIVVLGVPASWPRFQVLSQGRYWIPLVFPALVLLANTKIQFNSRVFAAGALAVLLIANGCAVHAIYHTYY